MLMEMDTLPKQSTMLICKSSSPVSQEVKFACKRQGLAPSRANSFLYESFRAVLSN